MAAGTFTVYYHSGCIKLLIHHWNCVDAQRQKCADAFFTSAQFCFINLDHCGTDTRAWASFHLLQVARNGYVILVLLQRSLDVNKKDDEEEKVQFHRLCHIGEVLQQNSCRIRNHHRLTTISWYLSQKDDQRFISRSHIETDFTKCFTGQDQMKRSITRWFKCK